MHLLLSRAKPAHHQVPCIQLERPCLSTFEHSAKACTAVDPCSSPASTVRTTVHKGTCWPRTASEGEEWEREETRRSDIQYYAAGYYQYLNPFYLLQWMVTYANKA